MGLDKRNNMYYNVYKDDRQNSVMVNIEMETIETKETVTVTVNDPGGLHLRAASELVNICKKHNSKVSISCGRCPEADGCSILSVMMLAAGKGKSLTVSAEGVDAKDVINKISGYFSSGEGI
jgi:phosphocarrier protein